MDDLADLVWQQAGVAKPHAAHSTHSTPLAQLAAHPRAPTPVDAARAASPRYPPLPPMMAASPSSSPAVPMAHYTSAPMRPASAAAASSAVPAARPSNDDPFGALVSFGSAAGGRNAQQASTAHMSLADQVKLKQQQQAQQPAYAITPMGASGRSTPAAAAARPMVQPQAPTPSLGQFDVAFLDSLVGRSSTPANGARIGSGGSHASSAANSARASPAPPLGLHPFAAPPLSGSSPAFAAPAPVATSSVAAADPWDLLLQGGGTSLSSPATPQPAAAAPTPANDDLLLGDFFSPAPAARAPTPLAAPTASPPIVRRATPNPPVPAAAASAAAAGIPPPPAPARRMSNPPGMALGASVAAASAAAASATTQTTPSLRATTPPARAEPSFDAKLAKLVDMGFPADMAAEALRATNGNLEQALHLVFNETMAREQQQQQQQSKVSSFLGKASSLLNKSKGIVQSKVGELKEQGGVLANMVNVVQARLQQPGSAGGDRTTPDEDHWEREARANFYGGQQPLPTNGSPAPSPPAARRTPPRPRSRTPPRTPPRGPSTGDLLGSLAATPAAPPVPPRPTSAAGLPPRAVTPVAPPAAAVSAAPAPPVPAPPKEKVRPPFPACAGLMADQSAHAKAQGNDAYRLGQYHEAVTYYSDAILALPANHLALVALHNNRAAAELKTGEYKEAIADTLAAVAVVEYYGGLDRPSETITDGTNTVGWADVTKALLRQASALENVEKYAEAKEQFAAVLARESGNKVASDGMARCQRALSPAAKQAADAAPAPAAAAAVPAAAPAQEPASVVAMFDTLLTTNDASNPTTGGTAAPETAPAVTQDEVDRSSRVRRLRAQERKAEAEAEAALAVKDEIDAQLATWRKGKETNPRALLASLELVLWPELGWQKVELGQLITPAQCKVRYMKAIAKLHPDKLQTENVAHKMIATAVFAQLNEAWDAFRTQNNM
ncbi:hypothetical protein GGF32_007823 [Allomyces javanicus]|nr:hypothetical protein GGF32_007823 [Allomyces javanicus]